MSTTFKVIFGLLALLIVISMATTGTPSQQVAKSPETKAKDERETRRYVMAKVIAAKLKESMRDPDSMVIESMRIDEGSTLACGEYRAKNGFGGVNREFIVVLNDRTSKKPAEWNKHCTKTLPDMMWAIK